MEALSKVAIQDSLPQIVDLGLDEMKTLNKKVSRLMLELFEMLMPTLQSLNSASKEFGTYSFEHIKKNSAAESSHRRNLAGASLIGVVSAIPSITEGTLGAVSAVSKCGDAYLNSCINDAATNKGFDQDLFAKAGQDQSTLQNVLEKLLSLVQQVLQTERSSG